MTIMDTIPDLDSSFEFAACGLVTTEVNGTIRRANATFCNWLGFSTDELIEKKKLHELFTIGGRFFHQTHLSPLLQLQGSVTEVQMDLVGKEGTKVPMLINVVRQKHGTNHFDQLAFFMTTERNKFESELISARKSAEESLLSLRDTKKELQKNRDFLSIAIRSARMSVWSQHIASNRVWWNPELEKLTGLTDNEYWGTSEDFYNLIHLDDRNIFIDELNKAIKTKSDYSIQFRLQSTSGSWLTAESRGRAIYSDTGEAISIFGIVIDISERKEAERKLYDLNQQLYTADRRKDEFLATLGHELRNPLAPMQNVLEIMRLKKSDDSFIQWSSKMIERHVVQMTHLVDDLMETSRISQGIMVLRKQQIDLVELVQVAIESSQTLIQESKQILTIKSPNTPIIIDADSTRLIQIISNLLTNAVKYTSDAGKICLSVYQDGDEAVLSVLDSGIGIPTDQLSNVFNMFSQLTPALERSQGGLGIGLALVQGLVKLHDGTITAYSDGEGKGSEFIVRLPISHVRTEIKSIIEKDTPSLADNKRILVIDDNVDATDSLSLLLEFSGHTTDKAYDGVSGIKTAEEFKPEIILLDIGLPDINGYEVAKKIRQSPWGKSMYLIATTGWGQDKDKQLAIDAGFDKHLTKPINFQELNSLLQTIVA